MFSKDGADRSQSGFGPAGEFAEELRKEMNEREARIREMAEMPELNISSPRQIGELLFDKLKLDPKAKKTARGSYTTDEATLTALSDKHPIIEEILEFRAVKKLLSTYIEPFPMFVNKQTGRVHTTFNQALTATGRLSSSNPNLQNIPIRTERGKEIRKAFVAGSADGLIVSADYSQIELRIMAHLSQDQHLIQAFRNGVDVHAATAERYSEYLMRKSRQTRDEWPRLRISESCTESRHSACPRGSEYPEAKPRNLLTITSMPFLQSALSLTIRLLPRGRTATSRLSSEGDGICLISMPEMRRSGRSRREMPSMPYTGNCSGHHQARDDWS